VPHEAHFVASVPWHHFTKYSPEEHVWQDLHCVFVLARQDAVVYSPIAQVVQLLHIVSSVLVHLACMYSSSKHAEQGQLFSTVLALSSVSAEPENVDVRTVSLK